ncbi:MAG: tRNA lysidine(34) synthetase TilS [Myxococcota bacterium]
MSPSHPGRLRHKVGQRIATHALWEAGHRVAVAVSGGQDSVALLDLLCATAAWHRGALSVVHVDHQTRSDTAHDAAFVEELSSKYGLPVVVETVSGGPDASEAQLREARYAVFDRLEVDRVALAHHRRDQAETVLLRLIQGAGQRGLGGMRWRRDRYVRPLLDVTRLELERWATLRGLSHREDPSNASPRYLRNRVRAQVLPLLEALRPGAERTIARAADHLAADEAFLEGLLEARALAAEGPWPLKELQALPEPLFRRFCLRVARGLRTGQIDELTQLVKRGYGSCFAPTGWTWRVVDGWLEVALPADAGG